jgi:hypothetical protein
MVVAEILIDPHFADAFIVEAYHSVIDVHGSTPLIGHLVALKRAV